MPADDGGNALNIDGADMTLVAEETDWSQVVTRADTFLARARALGSNINQSATLQVQAWCACALWRLGRTDEAQRAAAEVQLAAAVLPNPAMDMHLCRGDTAAAQALLVARLDDENTRSWVLRFIQPARKNAAAPLEHLMQPVAQAVRIAPDVVSAANRVGRVLPQQVDAARPKNFDPFRMRPRSQPLGPGAT